MDAREDRKGMVFGAAGLPVEGIDELGTCTHEFVELLADGILGLECRRTSMGAEAAEHGGIDRIALGEASEGTGKRAHTLRLDDADRNAGEDGGIGQRALIAGGG